MEGQNKHFSHTHNLNLHQLPEGAQITCSGCNTSGTGIVYACWQCNFILHEQCFHASRSLKHPSHPSHPLALIPYPTYPSNSFYCNSCTQVGTGFSYSCPDCEFDLHVHCAYTITKSTFVTPNAHINPLPNQPIPNVDPLNHPLSGPRITDSPSKNEDQTSKVKTLGIKHFSHPHALDLLNLKPGEDSLTCSFCEEIISGSGYSCPKSSCDFYLHSSCFELAKKIEHKSHPKHTLTLRSSASGHYGQFDCSACRNDVEAFMYHCAKCEFNLHIKCVSLPESVERKDHEHPLKLFYSCPLENFFSCDVCRGMVHDDRWNYFCKKCDYGIHVDCVNNDEESPDGENSDEKSEEASQVDDESDPEEESADGENPDEESNEGTQVDDGGDSDVEQDSSTWDPAFNAQLQMQRLQLQMQMSRQNAKFMMSMGSSLAKLA